jgi:hypothetical protein
MPNRYIRESAIESEAINSLSWEAEVFLRRLFNRVDDFGRHSASTQLLRAALFPLQLDRVSEKKTEAILSELESVGLLAIYQVDGKKYLQLAKWEQGRAKTSKHPSPSSEVCKRLQTYVYNGEQVPTNAPDSDSDSDSDTDPDSDSLRSRINKWFSRRENTEWSDKELKALKPIVKLKTPESDLQLLDARYELKNKYRRKDILTLLNNWNTEIDRCKSGDDDSQQSLPIESAQKKELDWRDSL